MSHSTVHDAWGDIREATMVTSRGPSCIMSLFKVLHLVKQKQGLLLSFVQ